MSYFECMPAIATVRCDRSRTARPLSITRTFKTFSSISRVPVVNVISYLAVYTSMCLLAHDNGLCESCAEKEGVPADTGQFVHFFCLYYSYLTSNNN
jgi:hypothetical protein